MGHALSVVAGVRDQNLEAVAQSNFLKALYQLREKRVRDVGNDQAELMAAAGNQGAGVGVRVIAEFADYAPDFFGGVGADLASAVDGARDRGRGDARVASDFGDPHGAHCTRPNSNPASENTSNESRRAGNPAGRSHAAEGVLVPVPIPALVPILVPGLRGCNNPRFCESATARSLRRRRARCSY